MNSAAERSEAITPLSPQRPVPAFLAGGGEAGARMRALDWAQTPLGDPEHWPQSLKTIVRVMLDSRYAMWMLWGPELTFFCNDAYLPTVGIKRDWVMGARSDKVWEEVWSAVVPRMAQVFEQGQATWDEGLQLFLARSGFLEETYHTFSYSPVYDDNGRIAGMLCVVTEITERVLSERGLRVLRDLAGNVGGAQNVRDVCQRLMATLATDQADVPFARLYIVEQQTAEAWLAAGCGDLPASLSPERISLVGKQRIWPLTQAIEHGEALLLDLPSDSPAIESPLWPDLVQRVLVIPVKNTLAQGASGVLVAGLSPRRVLSDSYRQFFELVANQFAAGIADAQSLEAERKRAAALAALDHAKTQFFSNVSHEFRTPLTLLLGPVEELLADPEMSGETRERLSLAHRNSLRLLKLVNSLLEFSRIEAGRATAAYEPVDLAAITRDISSTFRSAVEKAGLRFVVECETLDEPAYIDREMWEKIVSNLLSNAFKFTLEGGISVQLRREGGEAVLDVDDTGVGVPEHEIPRLFERFHRVEGTRGRTHEGSGIGLALVYELVKLHAGTIEVRSTLKQGTLFRIRLPLGEAHLPRERVRSAREAAPVTSVGTAYVQEALRWTPTGAASEQASLYASLANESGAIPGDRRFASTFGARIVLADDNADMRDYVRTMLTPHYQLEVVNDGAQALAAAFRQAPDLIVSDVMMPHLDGFGLLRALRSSPELRGIPVILLSARAGEESRIEGLDAGADDYLVKPFSKRELFARVGALLERNSLHRKAVEQLEAADRQKDEFLAMLAHELRNPLAPIRNAGEVLSRALPSDTRAQAAVGIVRRQVTHLTRLVDDLLDVSRITQGRIDLRRQPVIVSEIITQALETVEPLLRDKRHKVSVTQSFETLRVNGDPARLVQCVANVLTNAAKYTDANGDIGIEWHRAGEAAIITVSDNGPGIAAELLPHIFDLFVQGERTLDRSQGGLGIGLSVVKRLIEMHGGEVRVRNLDADQGTSFEIRLPLVEAADVPAEQVNFRAGPVQQILVVDDNQDAAESLAMLLSFDGHDIRVVHSAQAALDALQQAPADIVLLDIGLPDIDGYEVARRIRATPALAHARIIALTGYGQSEDRRRTEAAGFDAHLVKPVDLPLLQQTLTRLP